MQQKSAEREQTRTRPTTTEVRELMRGIRRESCYKVGIGSELARVNVIELQWWITNTCAVHNLIFWLQFSVNSSDGTCEFCS